MLYDADAFDTLVDDTWDEARVRDAVAKIVARVDDGFRGPTLMWRANDWDGWHSTSPQKNLYVGVAGVVWVLDALAQRGFASSKLDLPAVAVRNVQRSRERPDYLKGFKLPVPRESSLFLGETGILLVTWRLTRDRTLADELHGRIRANVDNEAEEIMWGSPGTLIAARWMYEATNEERWRDSWHESAQALLSRRRDGLWTQRLYGREFQSLTPPHGLVGNVQALAPLVDDATRASLFRDSNEILARTAVTENGLANWPPHNRPTLAGPDGEIRLQWCSGAPGIVLAAGDYLDEDLLLAGAELVWKAGPHGTDKGPGICHGTAGNGYAFLRTFARTGDEKWLERARKFAMHALGQTLAREPRYSLWTGDLGAAIYATDCIAARADYPILDTCD